MGIPRGLGQPEVCKNQEARGHSNRERHQRGKNLTEGVETPGGVRTTRGVQESIQTPRGWRAPQAV